MIGYAVLVTNNFDTWTEIDYFLNEHAGKFGVDWEVEGNAVVVKYVIRDANVALMFALKWGNGDKA